MQTTINEVEGISIAEQVSKKVIMIVLHKITHVTQDITGAYIVYNNTLQDKS